VNNHKYENKIHNVAIFGLVRGYEGNLKKYSDLITRNNSIYNHIVSKLKNPYHMLLFHEADLTEEDKKFIQKNYQGELEFISVDSLFKKYKKTTPVDGYKIMCKFNMYYLWNYIFEYDYVIRVDEDIEIINFDIKTIDSMYKNKVDFSYSKLSFESHIPTNETLPFFIKSKLGLKNYNFYNHLFPYTNVYVSNTSYWKNKNIQILLKEVAESHEQLENRWGDLSVLGCVLNIFKSNTQRLSGIKYKHISHKALIKNKFYLNFLDYIHYKRLFNKYPKLFKLFLFIKEFIKNLIK